MTEKWTAISGSFFEKSDVAGLILGCRFVLRVLVETETKLCRKSLVWVMSLRDLSAGHVQTDVPGRSRAALAGVVIVARLLYRSSMEQRMFFSVCSSGSSFAVA